MSKKIIFFDVDGTLTPARKSMTASFASDFLPFLEKNICYIIYKIYKGIKYNV